MKYFQIVKYVVFLYLHTLILKYLLSSIAKKGSYLIVIVSNKGYNH